MPESISGLTPDAPFAERLHYHRVRAGKTRAVVGGLVGRSAGWVKGLETGRLGMPRLPKLIRLAEVLDVDLADLTGEQRLSRVAYAKAAPGALEDIRSALASYPLGSGAAPVAPGHYAHRVRRAWETWHTSLTERESIAPLLPGLLADGRGAMRALDGRERRQVAGDLAQVYHLAQLYCSHTPAPELVYLTGDRAMLAAQDADDPAAMAGAAWYLNHVWRDAGEAAEARVEVALGVAGLLRPEDSVNDRALYALMHLAVALSHAKLGREGDAWRHHDVAMRASGTLGGYVHPWLMAGRGVVEHYAVTIDLDLQKPGRALQSAKRISPGAVPSRTRQSRYLVEVARAHHRQRDHVAAVHLMRKAEELSKSTFEFSLFAKTMVSELMADPPALVADEVDDLARSLHLIA